MLEEAPVTVYATPNDLAGPPWNLSLPKATAETLLARAATMVRNLTVTAIYQIGSDGRPSEPAVRDALRDATCAQASWFDETGDTGSGASNAYSTMSLGSARLSVGGAGSSTNTSVADSRYSPEAVQILTNAGLLAAGPRAW